MKDDAGLRTSELPYGPMVGSMAGAVLTVQLEDDKAIKIVHSPDCFTVTGYSAEEFLVDPFLWINMVLKEDQHHILDCAGQLLRGGDPGTVEHRITHKDGSIRWVECTHIFHPAVSGNIPSCVRLIRDITRRRQAEADLQFANILLSAVREASIDGILVVDENGRILTFNRRFADMWGIPADVLESRSDECALQSVMGQLEDPEAYIRKVKCLYESHNEMSRDEILLKNGLVFDRYSGPVIGPGERYYGRIWCFRDITFQKKETQLLLESEERFRTLAEAIPDAVLVGQDGLTVYANPAAARLLRYAVPEELVGLDMVAVLYPDQNEPDVRKVKRMLTGEDMQPFEDNFVRSDGSSLSVEIVGSRMQWGGLPAVQIIARDVTERKLELSRMVMQEKMASVGLLAAGVAHEINNPLNFVSLNFETLKHDVDAFRSIVVAYRDLLRRLPPVEDMGGEFEKIRKQEQDVHLDYVLGHINELFAECDEGMQRVLNIVCSMRDFCRMNSPDDFTPFDINTGIRNTLVITRNVYKYCAEVCTNLGAVPEIACLPDLVNRVLLNLVVNAAQAIAGQSAEGGRGRITITTYADSDNVFCEIADTGPGIPRDVRARIFDPFFTTKEPGQGLGLGLSISRDIIVNAHGGSLEFDSTVGEGTRFLMRLPIARSAQAIRPVKSGEPRWPGDA